ncbi:PREDICTED: uncharacterized protein LOC106819961 [Priapulus caudatus]|uniref:Uncharacterized protein LOC106819961 n=1 Tax=Priapulus caudatus TaxID=37621 RepID=A0ABM1F6E1_PRICU|nr:PREDICTED: uncharacterized protein LOC106819961 [Priapulus caudatus]
MRYEISFIRVYLIFSVEIERIAEYACPADSLECEDGSEQVATLDCTCTVCGVALQLQCIDAGDGTCRDPDSRRETGDRGGGGRPPGTRRETSRPETGDLPAETGDLPAETGDVPAGDRRRPGGSGRRSGSTRRSG